MKKISLLIAILLSLVVSAQNYNSILLSNVWKISSLTIDDELFYEQASTCVYSTTITFNNNNTLLLNRPCMTSPITENSYVLLNNLLIIDEIDTLTITNINTTSFTTTEEQLVIDDEGNEYPISIITTYEKN